MMKYGEKYGELNRQVAKNRQGRREKTREGRENLDRSNSFVFKKFHDS
jgi:hypothetical protein